MSDGKPKLEPCPFCGSTRIGIHDALAEDYWFCYGCCADGPSDDPVGEKWNRRPDAARTLAAEVQRLRDENNRLRAALAVSKSPCVYCQLPAEEMAKCRSGFPGCARADDMMGCAELGASLERDQLQAEIARLRQRVGELEGCLQELVHEWPPVMPADHVDIGKTIRKARELLKREGT